MPIPELNKFRQKYPQYNDIDDITLAKKLATKYPQYSDIAEKADVTSRPTMAGRIEGVLGKSEELQAGPLMPTRGVAGKIAQAALPAVGASIPGGQSALEPYFKSPATRGVMNVAGAVGGPLVAGAAPLTVARTLAGGLAGSKVGEMVAPKTPRLGATIGGLAGAGVAEAGGRALGAAMRPVARGLSGRIINSMIGPNKVAFKYGKNPGKTVAKLGIKANSLEELGTNIDAAIKQKISELGAVLAAPQNVSKRFNLSNTLQILDDEILNLQKAPASNKAMLDRLSNLKADILGMTRGAKGRAFQKSLTPEQALEMKRFLGEQAKWSGGDTPPAFDSLIHKMYHSLRTAIENVIPDTKNINADISGLIGASKAVPGAVARSQRGMLPFMARSAFSGGVPFLLGGGPIGAAAGMGTNLLLSTPATGTRIAGALAKYGRLK